MFLKLAYLYKLDKVKSPIKSPLKQKKINHYWFIRFGATIDLSSNSRFWCMGWFDLGKYHDLTEKSTLSTSAIHPMNEAVKGPPPSYTTQKYPP